MSLSGRGRAETLNQVCRCGLLCPCNRSPLQGGQLYLSAKRTTTIIVPFCETYLATLVAPHFHTSHPTAVAIAPSITGAVSAERRALSAFGCSG